MTWVYALVKAQRIRLVVAPATPLWLTPQKPMLQDRRAHRQKRHLHVDGADQDTKSKRESHATACDCSAIVENAELTRDALDKNKIRYHGHQRHQSIEQEGKSSTLAAKFTFSGILIPIKTGQGLICEKIGRVFFVR